MGNNSIKFCCKVNCTPKDRGVKTGVSGTRKNVFQKLTLDCTNQKKN